MEPFTEQPAVDPVKQIYTMILFIVADGQNSKRARENLEHLCEQWLPGRHWIQIVDVVKDFQTAIDYNILLTPSVVITDPLPQVIILGDLSDSRKFIKALKLTGERTDVD